MSGKHRIWLVIILSGMAFSCSRSGRVPSDIIGREKMGAILFDIGMAEGHLESFYFRDSTANRDSLLRRELDKVLAIHHVSQSEFRRSYDFYKTHPAIFKVMTDSLQAQSQRSQDKLYGKRPKPGRKIKE
jgi:hypothetical protein